MGSHESAKNVIAGKINMDDRRYDHHTVCPFHWPAQFPETPVAE
jgi:hypothetical protein